MTKLTLKRKELVDVAKSYNTKKTIPMVVLLVFLIVLPSIIGIIFASPAEMYGRYYNFMFDYALYGINDEVKFEDLNIEIEEDEYGYIKSLNVIENATTGYYAVDIFSIKGDNINIDDYNVDKPTFIITNEYIYFTDPNDTMKTEVTNLLAYSFYNIDFTEIFETIFIYNGYLTVYFPIMLVLVTGLSLLIIFIFYILMGITFNIYSRYVKLSFAEMYKLLLFNSIIPIAIAFFIGLFLPTIHIFLCQMMVAYNMHISIKSKEKKIIKDLRGED